MLLNVIAMRENIAVMVLEIVLVIAVHSSYRCSSLLVNVVVVVVVVVIVPEVVDITKGSI